MLVRRDKLIGGATAVVGRMQQDIDVVKEVLFRDAPALALGRIRRLEMRQPRVAFPARRADIAMGQAAASASNKRESALALH